MLFFCQIREYWKIEEFICNFKTNILSRTFLRNCQLDWVQTMHKEEFKDIKGAIRIRISKKNTIQWPKEKVPKNKQRSTKHTHKTKDRVTRIPLKTGGELRCSGRVGNSCSTSGTRRVNLVTNPMISHEWGKDLEIFTTSGTYLWSFLTQILHNGQPSHGGHRKTFEVITST